MVLADSRLAVLVTVLIVNLRHLWMGASLREWFWRLARPQAYLSAFFPTDESWALTVRQQAIRAADGAFLLGSGLILFVSWMASTLVGFGLGVGIVDPAQWGLDLVSTAAFAALLAGLCRGRGDLVPWLAAGAVAVLAAQWLPSGWHVLLGEVVGAAWGALRHEA